MTQVHELEPVSTDRENWLAERRELLALEKEHTRRNDEITRKRMAMPWLPIDQAYLFDTEHGPATLLDLFDGRSQLIVYHFMFGLDWDEGCPSCSAMADGFDKTVEHLRHHDVAFWAVSRAPIAKLLAYRERLDWSFPWASSSGSDFNLDFEATFTEEAIGRQQHNYATPAEWLRDPDNLPAEAPGMSVFARRGDDVYLTYGAYTRGLDTLWNMWQWLDRTPNGRNEGDFSWFARRDTYAT